MTLASLGEQAMRTKSPAVTVDGVRRDVGNKQDAGSIQRAGCLAAERGSVGYERIGCEAVAVELNRNKKLVVGEKVRLVDGDGHLGGVDRGVGLDLQCDPRAVGQAVDESVDAAVEKRQKDVKAAA